MQEEQELEFHLTGLDRPENEFVLMHLQKQMDDPLEGGLTISLPPSALIFAAQQEMLSGVTVTANGRATSLPAAEIAALDPQNVEHCVRLEQQLQGEKRELEITPQGLREFFLAEMEEEKAEARRNSPQNVNRVWRETQMYAGGVAAEPPPDTRPKLMIFSPNAAEEREK